MVMLVQQHACGAYLNTHGCKWFYKEEENVSRDGTFAPVMNLGTSPVPPCRIVFLIPSEPRSIVSFMSDIFFIV